MNFNKQLSSFANEEICPCEIWSVNIKIEIIFFNFHDVVKTVGGA